MLSTVVVLWPFLCSEKAAKISKGRVWPVFRNSIMPDRIAWSDLKSVVVSHHICIMRCRHDFATTYIYDGKQLSHVFNQA